MDNTTNSWEEELATLTSVMLGGGQFKELSPLKDFIRTLLHDTEIAACKEGYDDAKEIGLALDKAHRGTEKALREYWEGEIAQAKKIAREEIKKEIDLAITQIHGGGNGRRLLEQLRDALSD